MTIQNSKVFKFICIIIVVVFITFSLLPIIHSEYGNFIVFGILFLTIILWFLSRLGFFKIKNKLVGDIFFMICLPLFEIIVMAYIVKISTFDNELKQILIKLIIIYFNLMFLIHSFFVMSLGKYILEFVRDKGIAIFTGSLLAFIPLLKSIIINVNDKQNLIELCIIFSFLIVGLINIIICYTEKVYLEKSN